MNLCDYGCGQEGMFLFKNGKWCCSNNISGCPKIRRKNSEGQKGKKRGPNKKSEKFKNLENLLCDYCNEKIAIHRFDNGKLCCSKSHNSCSEMRRKNGEGNRGEKNYGYGKKRPDISERMKGENNPMYGMIGDKNPMFGIKRLDVVERMTGQNNPAKRPEVRQKISDKNKGKNNGLFGENHPNWKGGISCEPYCIQWNDTEYKDWIKFERDEGKCNCPTCNEKSTKLCLHHINYDKKDCRPTNLITICISCNSKANFNRNWHEAFYNEIIKRKYLQIYIRKDI